MKETILRSEHDTGLFFSHITGQCRQGFRGSAPCSHSAIHAYLVSLLFPRALEFSTGWATSGMQWSRERNHSGYLSWEGLGARSGNCTLRPVTFHRPRCAKEADKSGYWWPWSVPVIHSYQKSVLLGQAEQCQMLCVSFQPLRCLPCSRMSWII